MTKVTYAIRKVSFSYEKLGEELSEWGELGYEVVAVFPNPELKNWFSVILQKKVEK